ncbi:MAG TPA: CYTH domain-containing protein [Bacteroidales bacterium]|nr:CYTH domain-containing protein [Bacteroidales bacterium]
MSTETERKFLVNGEFRHLSVKEIEITQAYLSIDPARIIRLRIAENKGFITIKSPKRGTVFSRKEWEIELPLQEANEILEITLPGRIYKTRHIIPSGNHLFEVDVFHDKNEGLILAEIELREEGECFERPAWLGKEVTGIAEYFNSNLIK